MQKQKIAQESHQPAMAFESQAMKLVRQQEDGPNKVKNIESPSRKKPGSPTFGTRVQQGGELDRSSPTRPSSDQQDDELMSGSKSNTASQALKEEAPTQQ